jgi:L-threonylcarbamoyladenylate synthase
VERVFAAKQRPRNHPLITHLASAEQLPRWAATIPDWVAGVVKRFWPGPLTLLLDRHPAVSDVITGGLPTIGLRVPNHPVLLKVLTRFDLAVAAPSANPYQKLSPTTAGQVMSGLEGKIAAVLDGGPCVVGTESTILRVHERQAEILRSGPISVADLEACLPFPVAAPTRHAHAVPGNQRVHYRPEAMLSIRSTTELAAILQDPPDDAGFLLYSPGFRKLRGGNLRIMPTDHQGYRQALYATLHDLDRRVAHIWVESPPRSAEWQDIWDRLSRAATA